MIRAPACLVVFTCLVALCGCGQGPTPLDGGSGGGDGGACPALTGAPINHVGTFNGTDTWEATSLHTITTDYAVGAAATVTIAPCAEVQISPGMSFSVNGKVIARGDATHPISIHGQGGRFNTIFVRDPGSLELAYATVEGGGATPQTTWGANILVEGGPFPPVQPLFVDHVTLRDAGGYGIVLRSWAGFAAGSTDLTVTNCGKVSPTYPYPVKVSLNSVGTLPTGTYTGNQVDEIQVIGETTHFQVLVDDLFHNRGVPYHLGGNGAAAGELRVGAMGSAPTLTIEPGVTVKLESLTSNLGHVRVAAGRLVAVGTQAQPILFTSASATPAAGAWMGIDFDSPVASGNRLEFARVEYAGGPGGSSGYGCPPTAFPTNDGAVRLFGEPPEAFVKSTTIADSLGHGVMRGWNGATVDFIADNTFVNIVGCNQIEPKTSAGTCPTNPSCPK